MVPVDRYFPGFLQALLVQQHQLGQKVQLDQPPPMGP